VTLGKPIGNGFPMGAVVMSPTLAHGFDNGMQYFATCGGCTASGAAGSCPSTCSWHMAEAICHVIVGLLLLSGTCECQCSCAPRVKAMAACHLRLQCCNTTLAAGTGLAVLDVLREERLQEAALATGQHLRAGLQRLQACRGIVAP
jgi:4-aminobutyrate aminotransferase-like enzyme